MAKKVVVYTWDQLIVDVDRMAEWALPQQFAKLYGIPSGGLMVAVPLYHRMPNIKFITDPREIDAGTLVVDDLVDHGNAIARLEGKYCLGKTRFATLYKHDGAPRVPDFWIHDKYDDEWIRWPWETEESSRYNGTEF